MRLACLFAVIAGAAQAGGIESMPCTDGMWLADDIPWDRAPRPGSAEAYAYVLGWAWAHYPGSSDDQDAYNHGWADFTWVCRDDPSMPMAEVARRASRLDR